MVNVNPVNAKTLWRWAAVPLFLLCMALLWSWLAGYTAPVRDIFFLDEVTVTDEAGRIMEDVVEYEGTVTVSAVLPAWDRGFLPVLEISGDPNKLNNIRAAMDGVPLYGPVDSLPQMLGNLQVSLPGDIAGRSLTITYEKEAGGRLPQLNLTDSGIQDGISAAAANKTGYPAAAFAVLVLLTMGVFLYGAAGGTPEWSVLLLALASLSQVFYNAALNVAVTDNALWNGIVLALSRGMLYVGPPLYLLFSMKKRRRIFAPLMILPVLFYVSVTLGQFFIPFFAGFAYRAGEVLYVMVLALLICSVMEYRDENPVFCMFLPGLGLCAAALGVSYIVSWFMGSKMAPYMNELLAQIIQHSPDQILFWWSVMLLMVCFSISILSFLGRAAARDAELQILSAREALAQEQVAVVRESAQALGELRHEVLGHYSILHGLCKEGRTDRLTEYLERLTKDAESIPRMAYTCHPAVNAVLTTMLARARKMGVKLEVQVHLPESLAIPDVDLCTLLINLLQNALDACEKRPEGAQPWLKVILHIRGLYLYVGVENSRFAPVEYDSRTGLCRTTKTDKRAHGYGLKTARGIARKYESELVLKMEDGSFSAETALQIPE